MVDLYHLILHAEARQLGRMKSETDDPLVGDSVPLVTNFCRSDVESLALRSTFAALHYVGSVEVIWMGGSRGRIPGTAGGLL